MPAWLVLVSGYLVLPQIQDKVQYSWQRGYCTTESEELDKVRLALQSLPILPITISSLLSLYIVQNSNKVKFGSLKLTKQARSRLRRANYQTTLTILLTVGLYLVLKTPQTILQFLFVANISSTSPFLSTISSTSPSTSPSTSTSTSTSSSNFLKFYSWNIFVTLFSALNTCANPAIYWTRFRQYRRWVQGFYRQLPEDTTISIQRTRREDMARSQSARNAGRRKVCAKHTCARHTCKKHSARETRV